MRLTKKNIQEVAREFIKAYFHLDAMGERLISENMEIGKTYKGTASGRLMCARSLYENFLTQEEFIKDYNAISNAFEELPKKIKEEPKTVKNAAPVRSMEEPKKAVKTAKKTETAPKTTAKKTTKRAVKTAEIVPINAANGKPFTGRNKETALAYLKKINSTDGRFFTWNGKKDAGYKVKAGQSGLKMAYFGTDSRGTYPVWHISQLVKTVDASAAEEVKETIKREITLDDDGGNGKKKVFKVTIRK